MKFLTLFGTYFDALLEFSKSSQKYWRKKFAKYLSADGCFVKTNTINCDDNDDATYLFPNTRAFTFTRQLMKRNFT